MNAFERILHAAQPRAAMPTGTREEIGEELIRRCMERDQRFEAEALAAEREGDARGCWLAMACRAQNKRLQQKIEEDLRGEIS